MHAICNLMTQNIPYRDILRMLRLPETEKMLYTLSKIRTGDRWSEISKLYDFPENSRVKSPEIRYEEEFINLFCKMISEGKSNREIAMFMEIDLQNKRHVDKFYKVLNRLRNRETYPEITKNYNW